MDNNIDNNIGKKYNMLTIIEKDIKKSGYYWCKCDCNSSLKSIRIDNLKNNMTKSCGCIKHLYIWYKYIGKKYNMLMVVSKDTDKGSDYYWCQCDCGSPLKSIKIGNLKNGAISCGCTIPKFRNKKLNTYDLTGEYGICYDFKDNYAYFDLEDYEKIKNYTWSMDKNMYFNSGNIRMHRLITNCPENMDVDHIYHNNYDNRKSQLRICTRQENQMNRKVKGYYFNKNVKKWVSQITIKKERIFLGYFKTEDEAKQARINAEKEYFGEFAYNRI